MTDHPEGRVLPPFPVNDETIAALYHALGTSLTLDDEGNHVPFGGDYTLTSLLDFYSGADDSRSTCIGELEMIPGVTAPTYEMWDQQYSPSDVIRALLDRIVELTKGDPDAESPNQ